MYTDGLADEPGSPAPLTPEGLALLVADHRAESAEQLAGRIEDVARSAPRRRDGPDDDIAYLIVRGIR
jgi:hypothetical protein